MVLIRINQNKILLSGNKTLAKDYIGQAQSQMNILLNQMSFQNLTQSVRRVWLSKDVFVECKKVYNYQECLIWARAYAGGYEQTEFILLVVYGNYEKRLEIENVNGVFELETIISSGRDEDGKPDEGYGTINSAGSELLFGTFTHCYPTYDITGNVSGANAVVTTCLRRHFQRLYNYQEILNNEIAEIDETYSITSALDIEGGFSNLLCSNLTTLPQREWSKTLDDLTITAFTYQDETCIGPVKRWKVSAAWQGQELTWDNDTTTIYPSGGFIRNVHTGAASGILDPTQYTDTHIGFDIWKVTTNTNDFEYYCGIMSDQEVGLSIFKLDTEILTLELEENYTSIIRNDDEVYDALSQADREKYVRLLGYGYDEATENHIVYWAALGRSPFYYKEVLNDENDITTYNMSDPQSVSGGYIETALWNPITREVFIQMESDSSEVDITVTPSYLMECHHFSLYHPAAGYLCNWYCDGAVRLDLPDSWSCYRNNPVTPRTFDCPIRISHGGEYYFHDAFCNIHPTTHTNLEFCTTYWTGEFRAPLDEYYLGRFVVGSNNYSKGRYNNYSAYSVSASWSYYKGHLPDSCCPGVGYKDGSKTLKGTKCVPSNCRRYTFDKWIFHPTEDHAFEYSFDTMTTEVPEGEDPEWNASCVWSDDWETESIGNEDILKAASTTFPYDHGWTAILFNAEDKNQQDVTNWVIYKDLEGSDGFFILDGAGNIQSIGSYQRAFFHRHYKTTKYDEVN